MTDKYAGQLGKIPPSGEAVTISGIEICRFQDVLLVETRQEVNFLDVLTKAGELPVGYFTPKNSTDDE